MPSLQMLEELSPNEIVERYLCEASVPKNTEFLCLIFYSGWLVKPRILHLLKYLKIKTEKATLGNILFLATP